MTLKKTTKAEATLFTGQSTTGPGVPPTQVKESDDSRSASDFVADILNLLTVSGLLSEADRDEADKALRTHFKCGTYYVAANAPAERDATARRVLALFNGRNARQVARSLRIGKTTVYRILKQSGKTA